MAIAIEKLLKNGSIEGLKINHWNIVFPPAIAQDIDTSSYGVQLNYAK